MTDDSAVEIRGGASRRLTAGDAPDLGWRTASCEFRCATGRWIRGRWAGVPVPALLEAVDAPPETTHLLVVGADGYRAGVPVTDAMGAVLAFERLDAAGEGTPRVIGPGLDSSASVRRVARIETRSSPPEQTQFD